MAETPRLAHLVVLVFLASLAGLAVAAAAGLYAGLRRSRPIAFLSALLAAVIALSYGSLLFGASLLTPNRTLAAGQWKYFCEADCHIAYGIESAQLTASLGPELKPLPANGRFAVVRLKTWFDPSTTSRSRGNGPLTPSAREVVLVDDRGRRWAPSARASALLDPGTPLSEPLRPGESYSTTLVFDVPPEAGGLRLLIFDADPISKILIDSENSPLHGKIYLALPLQ
jgi:hypothetical protein